MFSDKSKLNIHNGRQHFTILQQNVLQSAEKLYIIFIKSACARSCEGDGLMRVVCLSTFQKL